MSHTPHELHDEFPDDGDALHALKLGNHHFGTASERHHLVNREIHRIESGVEAASDAHLEGLKKQRLKLVDEVAAMIRAYKAEA